jgi:hypothetical protein
MNATLEKILRKLTPVAENIEKVFDAGYKKGYEQSKVDNVKAEQEKFVDITENGTFEIPPDENKVLSKVTVNVDVPSDDSLAIGLIQRDVTEVNIPEGITNIGAYSFAYCGDITDIIIPDGVASIGKNAFQGCLSLTSIDIPNSVTIIGEYAFYDCRSLTNITIPNGITSIGISVFCGCSKLTSVEIPKSVTSISNNAFQGSGLTTVTIPNSTTSISLHAFNGCSYLEFVTIEQGFNCDGLRLSVSTRYSRETIVSWFEALSDRTGQTAYTLTIGATNLAKLTEDDIWIANSKNWTIL